MTSKVIKSILNRKYKRLLAIVGSYILTTLVNTQTSFASSDSSIAISWTKSRKDLHSSLVVPYKKSTIYVEPTFRQILTRIETFEINKTIDPVGFFFKEKQPSNLLERVSVVAKVGMEPSLAAVIGQRIIPADDEKFFASIKKEDLELLDKVKLKAFYRAPHLRVMLDGNQLNKSNSDFQALLDQTEGYLTYKQRLKLRDRIKRGEYIDIDVDLLPAFAKKRVKTFNIVRGPNCFQTALAFQGEKFASLPFVNPIREQGYDDAMINYDELWTALGNSFYEVNPRRSELKYGDIIVFSDVSGLPPTSPLDYRMIKHASTYLFGGLVFSKGSKSANSPYTIKHLDDEWKTWQKFSKELAVKVFRRAFKSVRSVPPVVKEAF